MARIRTIKPSFWASLGMLSRDARLLAVGLVSLADDAGRFVATPSAILAYVYPLDENVTPTQVRKWLRECVSHEGRDGVPLIVLYDVEGRQFGYFPHWKRHQKINRPQPSALPAPPAATLFEVS